MEVGKEFLHYCTWPNLNKPTEAILEENVSQKSPFFGFWPFSGGLVRVPDANFSKQ